MADLVEVEISAMYTRIEHLEDPEKVLIELSHTENLLDWTASKTPLLNIRIGAYAVWLSKHGWDEWYEFLKELLNFYGGLTYGALKLPGNPPEGWIDPIEFCKMGIPETSEDRATDPEATP